MSTREFRSVSEAFGDILGDDDFKDELEQQMSKRRVVKTLSALRAAKGKTQKDIAQKLGSTQSRVSKIENGFDSDLRFSELEAYAKALGCEITLIFSDRGRNLADQIKHHAFAIRQAFLKLASLAHEDPVIAQGVADLNVQAFQNINRFLQEAAENLPLRPDSGQPYIRIAQCELLDDAETVARDPLVASVEPKDAAVAALS